MSSPIFRVFWGTLATLPTIRPPTQKSVATPLQGKVLYSGLGTVEDSGVSCTYQFFFALALFSRFLWLTDAAVPSTQIFFFLSRYIHHISSAVLLVRLRGSYCTASQMGPFHLIPFTIYISQVRYMTWWGKIYYH